ncbi:unnamed protein product [Urochloa decumbens]|uniref:Uncharacterized protein n=1 Tax=Urochloa decumbens TaxID=240449 RepID=A0ABC9B7D9_9POAL
MAGGVKRKEAEVAAPLLRRLVRLAAIREASVSEQSEILALKREADVLMKRAAAEEPQLAAGNKRKKVIKTLVPREAIEYMILKPHKPLDGFPKEKLVMYSQELREFYAKRKAIADNLLEYERALMKQFRKKGYAVDYKEIEVTDNDES